MHTGVPHAGPHKLRAYALTLRLLIHRDAVDVGDLFRRSAGAVQLRVQNIGRAEQLAVKLRDEPDAH